MPDPITRRWWQVPLTATLLLVVSPVFGSMIGLLLHAPGTIGLLPLGFLFLVPFVGFECWWLALLYGAWVGLFPPRRRTSWVLLGLSCVVAGVWVSWRFQIDQPFYWNTGDEDVRPDPVVLASRTTLACSLATLASVAFCAVFLRRYVFRASPAALLNPALQRTSHAVTSSE